MEGCIELCWLRALTNPPLHYVCDATGQDENSRVHTKSGTIVDYIVLPAMYQYKYGPLKPVNMNIWSVSSFGISFIQPNTFGSNQFKLLINFVKWHLQNRQAKTECAQLHDVV